MINIKVNLLNPSCGDDVTIQVLAEDKRLKTFVMMGMDVLFVVLVLVS